MPFTYSSDFWLQRARDVHHLAAQMSQPQAREAMITTAWKYQLIHFRCVYHESTLAFDRAKAALLNMPLDIGMTEKDALAADLQIKRTAVDEARRALESHRKTIPGADICSVA